MESNRANENDNPPPTSATNPFIQANSNSARPLRLGRSPSDFDYVPDEILLGVDNLYSLLNPHLTQGTPETSGNPIGNFMNSNSFQNNNPQINVSSNSANANLVQVPSLPELDMGWNQQFINQGHNAISSGGMSNLENHPMMNTNQSVARNFHGDLQMNRQGGESRSHYLPMNTAPVLTRNNVSLGIGGNEEEALALASTESNMARARRGMIECANSWRLHGNTNASGFSNQLGHADRMASTNTSGYSSTSNPNPNPNITLHQFLQMQQNDMQNAITRQSNLSFQTRRNLGLGFGDLDQHIDFVGNQDSHSGTFGGNSAQNFISRQLDLNRLAQISSNNPSWTTSHTPYAHHQNMRSFNSPSVRQTYAGQQLLQPSGMPSQSSLPQRVASPQVTWVSSGQTVADAPFPKRLGVEFNNGDNTPQAALNPVGTNLQTTNTVSGSTRVPDHLLRHSVGRTDGGRPINIQLNSQEPVFARGQSQNPNALVQLPRDPRVAASSSNAPSIGGRPCVKRGACAPPQPQPHWVQRQKTTHPTTTTPINHPMPISSPQTKPSLNPIPIPVSTRTTNHASVSHIKPASAPANAPVIPFPMPYPLNVKPHVPMATAPVVSRVTWKDRNETPRLSGHKCYLCKRDLALTCEGAVSQPSVPPPVAVLPCGHTFHDQCLQNITPQDQAKDPPCIPCAIGEN